MDEELYHYGVKGMKWGVRRTRAQLGHDTGTKRKKSSVVSRVKERLTKKKKSATEDSETTEMHKSTKKKKLSEMSDQELRQTIDRMRLEQQYAQLNPQKVSAGKKFFEKAVNEVIVPSVTNAAKSYINGRLDKVVKDALKEANPDEGLKKKIERMNLQKQAQELEDYFSTHEMSMQARELRLQRQQAELYDYLAKRSDNIAGYLPAPEDRYRN